MPNQPQALPTALKTLNALMIAGTDTDAGKTVLTAALTAYWQQYCKTRSLALMKPFQSGVGDREFYTELFPELLSGSQTPEQLNPVAFSAPLAPPIAAALEGKPVAVEPAWRVFQGLTQSHDFVLVEGLGGLGSPVTFETTVADLAADWRLPIVLVVPVKLGAIGQAVANCALAQRSGLTVVGIVRSCAQTCGQDDLENWANEALIERLTGVPVLGTLPFLLDIRDKNALIHAASDLDLEAILPLIYA